MSCRYYQNKFPEVGDIVMSRITAVTDMGVQCTLPEYGDIDGAVTLKEMSRKVRYRSLKALARIGEMVPLEVLSVDEGRGYIDLSKKKVTDEEVESCKNLFAKSKVVNVLANKLAHRADIPVQSVYENIIWPLHENHDGAVYDALRTSVKDRTVLGRLNVGENLLANFAEIIASKMGDLSVKVRADVDVRCYGPEGIDAIKRALTRGKISSDNDNVEIFVIKCPVYIFTCKSDTLSDAFTLIRRSIDIVRESIESEDGGSCKIVKSPAVINTHEIEEEIREMEEKTKEVDGDDDADMSDDDFVEE